MKRTWPSWEVHGVRLWMVTGAVRLSSDIDATAETEEESMCIVVSVDILQMCQYIEISLFLLNSNA